MNERNYKGITLIALVITIVIILILTGTSIQILTGSNGVIDRTVNAKNMTNKGAILEKIKLECLALTNSDEIKNKDSKEIFEIIKENLDLNDANFKIYSKCMHITTKEGWNYTVGFDLSIYEELVAYLDIADGTIDLKQEGYVQNNKSLVKYGGKYIITGTSKEHVVRVMEEGTYNIVLKDLNIDVSEKKDGKTNQGYCAFNANRGAKSTGCFVNIILEGENYLIGGSDGPGLGFSKAKPNVDGERNGSTLTIDGNGSLYAKAGPWASGIGSGYTGWEASSGNVSNIIINGGNIEAVATINGAGIGSALHASVNNIIINGGNIIARGGNGSGIGVRNKSADNIIINGGNIEAYGSDYGSGIGGGESGSLKITGGNIYSTTRSANYSAIGNKCNSVKIKGGTIRANSNRNVGIYGKDGSVEITGGNILLNAKGDIGTIEGNSFIKDEPKSGDNKLYLSRIKLSDVEGNIKIESLVISGDISYGTNDVYTLEDDEKTIDIDETGMLYLYLPKGKRRIDIKVKGKEFSGEIETNEENSISILE